MRPIEFRAALLLSLLTTFCTGVGHAGSTSNGGNGNMLATVGEGYDWSCAIDVYNEVQCWYGIDGVPQPVGIGDARQLSVSLYDACAVNRVGDVYCWNRGDTPTLVPGFGVNGGGNADQMAVSVLVNSGVASGSSTCVLGSTGKVYCWGANEDGQLGDGTTTDRPTPVQVLNVTEAVALYTGSSSTATLTCAIRLSGGVRCWGDHVATPYAITNLNGARVMSIGLAGVCVWRQVDSLSELLCAPPDKQYLANVANFTKVSNLFYPQGLAGNIYGGVCIADAGQINEWKCRDNYYGLAQAPRGGYMTTLPYSSALSFGDYSHSCAEFADRSLGCMAHGILVPPCDLATEGADCVNGSGAWTLVPNLKMAEKRKPQMFGKVTLQKLDSRTSTSLSFSWVSPAQTTGHTARICDGITGQCTAVGQITKNGNKYCVTVGNLQPNKDYSLLVTPSNWASVQQSFGMSGRTLQ
jgi:hypothetical protein